MTATSLDLGPPRAARPLGKRLRDAAATIGVWLVGLAIVFPFVWMFVQAVQPNELRFAYPPVVSPSQFSGAGFTAAFADGEMVTWLRNSMIVAVMATLLSLFLGAGAAYAIARYRGPLVASSSYFILSSQMVPPVVLMIPLYRLVSSLGLFDSLVAVVIGNLVFTLPVVTWMLAASFRSVPIELEEAGMVDGCGRLGVLLRITMPVSWPGIASAAAFAFNWAWQEFLFARLVVSSDENWVGGMGIASFMGVFDTPWDAVMAATVIFTLPPVLFFLLAQRRFVDSVGGGLKG